jgi:hypothetical protein
MRALWALHHEARLLPPGASGPIVVGKDGEEGGWTISAAGAAAAWRMRKARASTASDVRRVHLPPLPSICSSTTVSSSYKRADGQEKFVNKRPLDQEQSGITWQCYDPHSSSSPSPRGSAFLVHLECEFCGTIGPVGLGGRAVKKKRFSVEQITSVLQQVASGVPVGDVCRQVGSQAAAHAALERATQAAVRSQGMSGVYRVTVNVGGHAVEVTGKVVNGVVRIGTAYIR